LITARGRHSHLPSYFSTRCIDYKQKDFSRKLNDRIVDYADEAKLRGVRLCRNDADLKERISEGKLVRVTSGRSYIVEKMSFSYPCLTPDSKILLDEIAQRLREKASQKGLHGVRFYITSMTRKTETIKRLRRYNGNASENSPHLYGNAFDISYKRFVARKWILTNCDKKFLKEALAEVISQLRYEKKCWATYERVQNCFHVVSR
jgi:intergrase/recombinase